MSIDAIIPVINDRVDACYPKGRSQRNSHACQHIISMPLVPPSFFVIVLGLAGIANDWRAAHAVWLLPAVVGEVIYAIAFLGWFVIAALYALNWIVVPAVARKEAEHAVQCCFIGLAGVATLLIAQGALPYSRPLAIALSALGAAFTLFFGLWRTVLMKASVSGLSFGTI